ncbi:MAG: hypothetical protein R2939_21495 [Kofleriaceae bacterium]
MTSPRALLALAVAPWLACGGAAPPPAACPTAPEVTTATGAATTVPATTPVVTAVEPTAPAPAARWGGTLLFDDSDRIRALDLATREPAPLSVAARLVEGLRTVGGGAATWVQWKDAGLRPHALRFHREEGELRTLIVEPEVDDVAPDGSLAIVTCPKKAGTTCVVTIGPDGPGEPTPIKWPKGAGRVHGWTTGGKVLVMTSSSLRSINLVEFEPIAGTQTARGTLPKDAQGFFDRDGRYVAWFEGGRGTPLALAFREVTGKDGDIRRLDLGVAHDARCEPTPANDAWACVVFPGVAEPGTLLIATLGDLSTRVVATDVEKVFGPLAFAPTGDAVAISQARGDKSVLRVVPLAGGEAVTVWQDEDHFISRPRPLGWLR